MKSHNGMRPQDIVILLKIVICKDQSWQYRDLAGSLQLSLSEISESLARSEQAGFLDHTRKKVHKLALMEFIEHGLRYVFPQRPGTLVAGVPTCHSYSYYRSKFIADIQYVWPDTTGEVRGLAITPLYKGVPIAVQKDETLHLLLASIDILRVGKTREWKEALKVLYKTIMDEL